MNTETTVQISDMNVPSIDRSQAVALTVSFSRIGDKREADSSDLETGADKDMTRLVKNLFCSSNADGEKVAKCKEFDAIKTFDGQTNAKVRGETVSLLNRRNVRLLRADGVTMIDTYLTDRKRERALLVDEFAKVYPFIVDNAKEKLGPQFRASDYPPVETVVGKFGMDWNYLALGVPENLPDSVKAVFAAKAEEDWKEAASDIRDGLRAGMVQLVDHLVERLAAKDGDKKSRFHDSTVGNVLDFIDSLERRDLTNDVALKAVADKARELIGNAAPADIREKANVRKEFAAKMDEVKIATDALLAPEKRRKFKLK